MITAVHVSQTAYLKDIGLKLDLKSTCVKCISDARHRYQLQFAEESKKKMLFLKLQEVHLTLCPCTVVHMGEVSVCYCWK